MTKGAKVRRLLGGTIWRHLLYRDSSRKEGRGLLRLDVEFKCDLTCPRFAFTVFLFPGLGLSEASLNFH